MQTPHCCSAVNGFTPLLNVKLIFLLALAAPLPSFPLQWGWSLGSPPSGSCPASALGFEEGRMAGTVNTQAPSSTEEGQQPVCGVIPPVGLKLWLWASGYSSGSWPHQGVAQTSLPCPAHRQGIVDKEREWPSRPVTSWNFVLPALPLQSPGHPPPDQQCPPKQTTHPGHPLTQNPSLIPSGFQYKAPTSSNHWGLRLTPFLRIHMVPSLCSLPRPYHQDGGCLFQGLLPNSLVQSLCLSPLYDQCHLARDGAWYRECAQ